MHIYLNPLPCIDKKDRKEAQAIFSKAGFADAENMAWLLSLTIQQRVALLKNESDDAKYLGIAL